MSTKYPGGIITKNYTAPTPTSASGIWTLEQQEQAKQAGIWPYGGPFNYIEDVFSTYVYTGTGVTGGTYTTGIDLTTNGGLLWVKSRQRATSSHYLVNAQDQTKTCNSNSTAAGSDMSTRIIPNSTGFGITGNVDFNVTGENEVAWTFRKQPKFFDVVTYTGNGTAGRTIAHNLGSVPGCMIVKTTSNTNAWIVYHQSLGATQRLVLNATSAAAAGTGFWNDTAPTSTVFSVGSNAATNNSGDTYVAYLFAHNAGGFGLTGTDNVVTCGSFSGAYNAFTTVNLGYEPQWVMWKAYDGSGSDWNILDVTRGWINNGDAGKDNALFANTDGVESTAEALGEPNATGFRVKCQNNAATTGNYVYIAIRRGPMKVPTDGTTVFSPIASSAAGGTALTTNFPVDLQMYGIRAGDAANITTSDRLRGVSTTSTAGGNFIVTSSTAAETGGSYTRQWGNTGFVMPVGIGSQSGIFWNFRRAPSFFDEVCYTGTGSATTFNHNLGVAPELMIVKPRSQVLGWPVWNKTIYAANADNIMYLDQTGGQQVVATMWNSAAPTSTTFPVGTNARTNSSAATYVAYLFATCPGVSKVGSYTGTGATQTIDCGFTGGARFVLIKRTNSTGGWAVFDTARGMVAGSDYSSDLNTTAAELNSNEVYTITTGFQLVSASTSYNASGSTYIYLAIA